MPLSTQHMTEMEEDIKAVYLVVVIAATEAIEVTGVFGLIDYK